MNINIEPGQIWKSKNSYDFIGYYTLEIVSIDEETLFVDVKFTASLWEDGHWTNGSMSISTLLKEYEKQ